MDDGLQYLTMEFLLTVRSALERSVGARSVLSNRTLGL